MQTQACHESREADLSHLSASYLQTPDADWDSTPFRPFIPVRPGLPLCIMVKKEYVNPKKERKKHKLLYQSYQRCQRLHS